MTETVVRLRPGTTENRSGGVDLDWSTPGTLTITGCLIEPRMEGENAEQGRQGRVIGWNVYAPDGVDVEATDRLRVRGIDYDVDGQPEDWSGGWEWKPGTVIKTRSARG